MAVLKLLHLLCFVYWLGGDLGTFYAARFVMRRELTPAARITAAAIMDGADLAPRVCMPLTLASGLQLAVGYGYLPLPQAAATVVWLLCALWLAMVLSLHYPKDRVRAARIARVDYGWRVLVAGTLAAVALAGLTQTLAQPAPWLALKLLCYAATVVCGLMVRRCIKPFVPAFARLAQQGGSAQDDLDIERGLGAARRYVVLIWVLLLVAALSGLHGLP